MGRTRSRQSGLTSTNYTIAYVNGTLTVTSAVLTIAANDQTRAYGAANPALTVSLQRLRQRRHRRQPDDAAHGDDDGDGIERHRGVFDHRERRGQRERELHHHLRERHVDGDASILDCHRDQQDADLRRAESRVHGKLHGVRGRRHRRRRWVGRWS